MDILTILIPVSLVMGLIGLVAFVWALRAGQFEDLRGAAQRILRKDWDDRPPR
jgi:cbb3-type cytochrome oxidase maturation protein